jgi:hypothetical protein
MKPQKALRGEIVFVCKKNIHFKHLNIDRISLVILLFCLSLSIYFNILGEGAGHHQKTTLAGRGEQEREEIVLKIVTPSTVSTYFRYPEFTVAPT